MYSPRTGLIALALLLTCTVAQAQVTGYGVAGLAGVSGFFGSSTSGHVVGGGEFVSPAGMGAAAEAGLLGYLGLFSLNGSLHIGSRSATGTFVPFVTAGYTRMGSGDGAFNLWNAGGGAHYWTGRHMGIRAEFRTHVRPDTRGTVQYWTMRAGIAVR